MEKLFESERYGEFGVDRTMLRRMQNHSQIFVHILGDKDSSLKIDIVNDVAMHFGEFETHDKLGKIDSWQNILSNKISAIFRFEPKDVADIWILSKKKAFDWMAIIEEAKKKEAGVDPVVIYNIIKSFPAEKLDIIQWVQKPDYAQVKIDLDIIADDLFYGRENSLSKK